MNTINLGARPSIIRTEAFRRRTANRVGLSLLGWGLGAGLLALLFRLIAHHWPDFGWWGGYFGGGLVFRAAYAYREVVALLERQNALLERLLERSHPDESGPQVG